MAFVVQGINNAKQAGPAKVIIEKENRSSERRTRRRKDDA